MAQKARILLTIILVSMLAGGIGVFYFIQPLARTATLTVVYGEGEDFYSQAVVYRKIFDENVYYLHLPHARTAYRWWLVDFSRLMIHATGKVRSLPFRRKFILRDDPLGANVEDKAAMGEWYWHFTESGAAFSGNGFTCKVSRHESRVK